MSSSSSGIIWKFKYRVERQPLKVSGPQSKKEQTRRRRRRIGSTYLDAAWSVGDQVLAYELHGRRQQPRGRGVWDGSTRRQSSSLDVQKQRCAAKGVVFIERRRNPEISRSSPSTSPFSKAILQMSAVSRIHSRKPFQRVQWEQAQSLHIIRPMAHLPDLPGPRANGNRSERGDESLCFHQPHFFVLFGWWRLRILTRVPWLV